jgi:prepilin-type N-terminal cleavage/methylation domain-containing protein
MKLHPLKSSPLSNNAGFTLLEIIAVLVILGILAVVAVPRYFDLQQDARNRAIDGAVAEAKGRINNYFASRVLNGDAPDAIDYTQTTVGSDMGDFTITALSGGGGGTPPATEMVVTVAGKTGTAVDGAVRTFSVFRPGTP